MDEVMGIKAPFARKQWEPEVNLLCGLLVYRQATFAVFEPSQQVTSSNSQIMCCPPCLDEDTEAQIL